MKHVVYGIIDPKNSQIYYIGRTSNFVRRKRQHINHSHGFAGFHTTKLVDDGFFPLFFILEQCKSRARSITAETYWIEAFRVRGAPLLNKENPNAIAPPMAGKSWSKAEDNRLTALTAQSRSISDLSKLFQRTRGAITSRLRYLQRHI